MDRDEFVERLRSARRAWEQVLAQVPPERMTAGELAGGWSVKDVVAHVTWSERELIGVVRQRALVGSPLWALDQDARNAAVYADSRERPLDEVLADEQRAAAELLPLLETLTTEELTDPAGWEQMLPGVPPWRIFAGGTFFHYDEHADQLRAWLGAAGSG